MSKAAHLVRNGLFNGGISYGSSEKDAKYATRRNWEINGTTKLLTLTSDYLHCLLRDKDSLHKFKAGFHNSLWTAKLVRENMYSYAISLTSFNKAGKGFRISDPIVQGRKRVQNFGPHTEGKEKRSEFLTPFHSTGKEKSSECLTPFNGVGKGFRISDPIQLGRKRVQNFWPHSTW